MTEEIKEEQKPVNEIKEETTQNEEQKKNESEGTPVMTKEDIDNLQKTTEGLLDSVREMVPPELLRKENPTEEDKEKIKEGVKKYLEREYLKKYSLDKVDLDAEYEKIKIKKSGLSRSQRDAVVGYFLIFKWGPIVQDKIKQLKGKENKTPEEEELLNTILGCTQLEDAYNKVKDADSKEENTEESEKAEEQKNE